MRFLAFAFLPASLLAADLAVEKDSDSIAIKHGTEIVAVYRIGEKVAKPYLWPLRAPGGSSVTRNWPMEKGTPNETTDHVHQKSAWFCHGDVIAEGLEPKTKSSDKRVHGVDFWSESAGHGRIVCTEVGKIAAKDGVATIPTKNEWRSPDGDVVLEEERTLVISTSKLGYLIAFDIVLKATNYPIAFGDTKEGSFGVRVPDSFATSAEGSTGTVSSSDGTTAEPKKKGTLKLWGQLADWNDYSGKVSESTAGIAIFDHPKNPHRAAWHTRDYGLMAANPFGRAESGFPSQKGKTELVKIKKGESLHLRYAIYTHTGDAKAGGVAEAYKAYAERK